MSDSLFHVLLIGVDRYDRVLSNLHGCVNDIDSVERLFTEPPGVGFPAERIRVTRLASRQEGSGGDGSSDLDEHGATRAEILDSLEGLWKAVSPGDRVHVHYSGHGGQFAWKKNGTETGAWSEGLLTSDGDWVTDTEMNAWLHAIASKTEDVTVVLDCCHSSGVTRGAEQPPETASRGGAGADELPAPGESGLRLPPTGETSASEPLKHPGTPYVVLAACQTHEFAQEKIPPGGIRQGMLTYSFVTTLSGVGTGEERAELKWADVWPDVLETAAAAAAERPTVPKQQPWLIGRPERKVFGGPWQMQDLGYAVAAQDGKFRVRAGSLMGVTKGAELAVYGPDPARFPDIGSAEDLAARVGTLTVESAGRTHAVAVLVSGEVPAQARARLVKPVAAEELRVALESMEDDVVATLDGSAHLRVVASDADDPEVWVDGSKAAGWTIRDIVDPRVATCPANETESLRRGLEHYAKYNQVLRLAHSCVDIELQGSLDAKFLRVELEDARRAATLDGDEFVAWLSGLPELPRKDGVYFIAEQTYFVVSAENRSNKKLRLFLFCCAAGGQAQYLDDMELRGSFEGSDGTLQPGERNVFWFAGKRGDPFQAVLTGTGSEIVDQYVVVGTNVLDAELRAMGTDHSVQDVITPPPSARGAGGPPPPAEAVENPELWTATVVPMIVSG